jgi:hypothetical protein
VGGLRLNVGDARPIDDDRDRRPKTGQVNGLVPRWKRPSQQEATKTEATCATCLFGSRSGWRGSRAQVAVRRLDCKMLLAAPASNQPETRFESCNQEDAQ